MSFKNENVAAGLPAGARFQVGTSNTDRASPLIESGALLTTLRGKERATWMYYDVAIECYLDSGIAVHRKLPQVDNVADTLAHCTITDKDIDKITGRGVNLKSEDEFDDVVQRMAHARYWFRLFGQAMRAAQQVPIPGIKKIGGRAAIPWDRNPQQGMNKIVGSYSGTILWYARWSLWYTLAQQPVEDQLPPQNLAQHIAADADQPDGWQSPITLPDGNAKDFDPRARQPELFNPVRG